MELLSTIVTVFSVVMSVRGQVLCRATFNCTGGIADYLGVAADGAGCCIGNPDALAYSPIGTCQENCIACIVVGFLNASFSGQEQGPGHSVPVGYLKGGTIAGQNLVFDVRDTPGTAREGSQFDYTVNTLRTRALANGAVASVVLTFRVDSIAQEPNETFTLTLDPVVAPNPREGLFFRNSIEVSIVDSDNVEFAFTEDDFRANEPDSSNPTTSLPVLASKSTRIASRVELVVVPLTVYEARATSLPLPPNIPQNDPRSPPFANLADFNSTNITLVFEPDEDGEVNEKSAPIFVTDDAINEATEQVFVAELILVSSLDSATVDLSVRPSTLCRIIDNDPIRIGFELPGYTYTEPQFDEFIDQFYVSPTGQPENGPIFLLKENNVISEQTFLVSFQVTDSAPSGTQSAAIDEDYRFGPPGETSQTEFFFPSQQRIPFPFELRADTLPEGTEAFQASVSPEDTRGIGGGMVEQFPTSLNPLTLSSEIFITILDDDPIIIGFTNTSYTVDEDIGTLQVDVRVLNVPDEQPLPASVDVVIQSVPGSATGGRDYREIRANFFDVFLTFDDAFRQHPFPVTIINDSLLEVDVEDFTLELRFDPFALELPANVILNPNVSTVEIIDDDAVVIGFLNTSYTVNENDGVADIQIGVIRGSLERSVVVRFSTNADSAFDGSDYSGFAVIDFTFDSTTLTVNVPVPLIDDTAFELTEQFGASLAFPGAPPPRVTLAPDTAQVTLLDDDVLIFGFESTVYSVRESIGSVDLGIFFINGNAGQFMPHLNASTADGTATANGDYISVADQSIIFSSANRNHDLTVQILSDDFTEVYETFTAVLSSVFLADTAGGAAIELTDQERARLTVNPDTATINILDDDVIVTIIGFQNPVLYGSEDSGGLYFDIAVLSGVLGVNVSIHFITYDNSAKAGLDYNASTISLALNPHSTMKSIYVGIIDDNIFERSESFTGQLISTDILPGTVFLEPTIATATIYDHKKILIGFNSISLTSPESNGTVALIMSIFNNMTIGEGNIVRVRVTTADNSAHALSDFIPISEVIIFSSFSTTQTVHVSIVNDLLLEIDEVFTASLSLEDETDRGHVQLNPTSASITIVDDDDAVIGFVPPAYTVAEGIDRSANLTVQLISGQLGRDVIVNFTTQSGSAIDGLDYLAILNRPLMFGPSVRSQVVRIEILDDLILEKDVENFTSTLSTGNIIPRLHLGVQLATVNITDNEIVRIGFQSAQYTVSEDSAIATIITIVVSGGSLEREIIVTFSTHDSTATAGEDYVGLSYRLTFDSSNTINVVPLIILDDQTDENMEIMSASLSFPVLAPKRVLLEPNATIVQIHDDDEADIGFISSHFTVRESDSEVNIQVGVLSGSLQKEVAIKFFVTESNAFAGEDYHEPQSLELTLDSTTSAQISIPIINNDIFELTESFLMNLSLIGGSSSQNSTRVLILDDDELVFGFSPSKYEIHEDDESAMVGIIIQGIPGDYQPVVFISTYNGTANEGEDFGAIASSEVTFTAGNRINNVTIPIIPNNSTESSEEFTITLDKIILLNRSIMLNLSEEERFRLILKPGIAVIKIMDDDVAVIGFLDTNLTIFEGGEVNFTIGVLQGYLDTMVTILFITESSNAQAGLDYTETSKLLNFTGDSVQTVSIQIIDDANTESSETFLGRLSSADGSIIPPNVLLQPNRATATINENDLPTESMENNSIITVLVAGLVSTLAFLSLMAIFTMVMCFVVKKKMKERNSQNPQEHVYESVLQPPGTLVTFSESSKLDTDLYHNEVKTTSCSTAAQFELTDNKPCCSSSSKPPAEEDEAAPGTDPQ